MRRMLVSDVFLYAVVALGFLAAGSTADAGLTGPGPGVTGNDTGGIIQWAPEINHSYKEIAVAHCARWSRYAGISSVHRIYGDYIGFACVYDRRFDPRKAGLPPQ
ncbi:MAG: hypothetical protein J2P53_07120 [Bradyrhizobiaceae bacterium]|nr:hypothetical protein [Bradyrhizobiaceae bacterium]